MGVRFSLDELLDLRGHERAAGAMRSAKRAADRFVGGHRGELAGVIDFGQQRSLVPMDGKSWVLTTPAREYMGEPGEWELEIAADEVIGFNKPFWLLALLGGLVDAQSQDESYLHGERCRVFKAVASYSRAAKASPTALGPFIGGPRLAHTFDVERMPLDVWVDAEHRVRRVVLFIGDGGLDIGAGWTMSLELWDFGVPDAIELPADVDVVEMWDHGDLGTAS